MKSEINEGSVSIVSFTFFKEDRLVAVFKPWFFFVGRRANAEARIEGRDTAKGHFFYLPPPPFRKEKNQEPQEKRQEDPDVLFMKTGGCPSEAFRPTEEKATLRREIEEGSCLEEKKISRINLEKKVGFKEIKA